jgi:hypothetical protein
VPSAQSRIAEGLHVVQNDAALGCKMVRPWQRVAMPSKKRYSSVRADAPSDEGIKTWIVDGDRDGSAELPGLRVNRPKARLRELHLWPGNHRWSSKRSGFERTRPLGFGFLAFHTPRGAVAASVGRIKSHVTPHYIGRAFVRFRRIPEVAWTRQKRRQ